MSSFTMRALRGVRMHKCWRYSARAVVIAVVAVLGNVATAFSQLSVMQYCI